ncbi:TetR family transcriptional regulator [Phenylobacterium sp.]|uniref:TetR family transcriptional regulator n=1 Tax=Phenylobacterium sp. TaxID=1871053 RepID=UPI0035ADF422
MPSESDHKQRTRERILSAAIDALIEGRRAIRLGSLMRSVGLTHGAFYAYFRSKAELLARAEAAVVAAAGGPLGGNGSVGTLERFAREVLEEARDPDRTPLLLAAADLARQGGLACEAFSALIGGYAQAAAAEFGGADGRERGYGVVAELLGAAVLARACHDPDQRAAVLHAAHATVQALLSSPPGVTDKFSRQ